MRELKNIDKLIKVKEFYDLPHLFIESCFDLICLWDYLINISNV